VGLEVEDPPRPPYGMQDVARLAGVSAATVSRVLNNSVAVDEAKRRKVLAAVEELGYRRNRVASNLRRQQAQMIGVVVSDIENPHFTQVVRAVEDAAYLREFRVLLCNTDEDPTKQRNYLEVLAAERVAGIIISPTDADAPEIAELLDLGTCIVAFDRAINDRRADAVLVANADGIRLGVEHLISNGHTKIGFVGGPLQVQTAAERLYGYEQTMIAAGLESSVAQGNFRAVDGRRATADLLEKGVTALLVANNSMTIGALQALRDSGRRVMRDVALISVDDPPWAELTDPPLTTLAQPVRVMADEAVSLLLKKLDGVRRPRVRQLFEFELRHRSSCCPAGPGGAGTPPALTSETRWATLSRSDPIKEN